MIKLKFRDHCKECLLPKKNNEDLFYKTPSGALRAICKKCHMVSGKKRRQLKSKESRRQKYLKFKMDPMNRIYGLWYNARGRAQKANLDFTVDLEYLNKIYNGKCSVTGIEFIYDDKTDFGKSHPFSPSLDKIDPKIGYTNENTRIVCWIYNRAKGDSSDAEVLHMARALILRNHCNE